MQQFVTEDYGRQTHRQNVEALMIFITLVRGAHLGALPLLTLAEVQAVDTPDKELVVLELNFKTIHLQNKVTYCNLLFYNIA